MILDEPTMGLSVTETRKTLDFVRGIKDAGKACIFIDLNLFNVHEICERVVVIDRGRVAGEFRPSEMSVHELVIWRPIPDHLEEQLDRSRPVLIELDSCYLPDTAGTAYRRAHVKTTAAITEIDRDRRHLRYFHNQGMYCLGGITRANVLHLCERAGITAREKSFSLTDVYGADEAFVTGTFAGISPVREVDGRTISDGRGPMVRRLQQEYADLVARDVADRDARQA